MAFSPRNHYCSLANNRKECQFTAIQIEGVENVNGKGQDIRIISTSNNIASVSNFIAKHKVNTAGNHGVSSSKNHSLTNVNKMQMVDAFLNRDSGMDSGENKENVNQKPNSLSMQSADDDEDGENTLDLFRVLNKIEIIFYKSNSYFREGHIMREITLPPILEET